MGCFINFTNHRLSVWSPEQLRQAQQYGNIIDVPFPDISACMTDEQLYSLAKEYIHVLLSKNPCCVLCQGESVFSTLMVSMLIKNNINVVAAVSQRKVTESINSDGQTVKNAVFDFVCFRKYIIEKY